MSFNNPFQLQLHQVQALNEIKAALKAEGQADLVFESICTFVFNTVLEEGLNESVETQEYVVAETPLSLIPDYLLEASLNFLYGDNRKYKKDKDGKKIVGMHAQTTRYKGSEKDRRADASKKYYHTGNNLEKQRLEMRRRRKIEAGDKENQAKQKDREEAEKTGGDASEITKARHAKVAAARKKKRQELMAAAREAKDYK